MRRLFLAGAAAAITTLGASTEAHAAGAIVTSPQRGSSVTEARVVLSSSAGRTTRWTQVRVEGTAGAFAWLVPVRPGAAVDLTSDAWIEALDLATAPRVLVPPVSPACKMRMDPEMVGRAEHVPTRAPDVHALALGEAELDAQLAAWGLALPAWLRPRIAGLYQTGWKLAALLYSAPGANVLTRTLRVVDDGAMALPLVLTASGSSPIEVTAVVIGDGRANLGALPAATIDAGSLVWSADGTSNYARVREATLLGSTSRWTIESSGNAPLFGGYALPRAYPALPSLVDAYYGRAQQYGDASEAASLCTSRARAAATTVGRLGVACAGGALMNVPPSASCSEPPASSGASAHVYRCGVNAQDVAFALAGLDPTTAWVTRASGLIPGDSFGEDVAVSLGTRTPESPAVEASRYGVCTDGGGFGPPTGTGSGDGWGSGGTSPPDPTVVVGSGCGGSTSSTAPGNDSCSSDTSSSYDSPSSGDDCGGDSSSSSSSDDSTDDSDTDDSDTDDDDYWDDDDDDDDYWDDDSSDSSDFSDSSDSSDSEAQCSVARKTKAKGRSPLSRWALGLAVLVFVVRRKLRPEGVSR